MDDLQSCCHPFTAELKQFWTSQEHERNQKADKALNIVKEMNFIDLFNENHCLPPTLNGLETAALTKTQEAELEMAELEVLGHVFVLCQLNVLEKAWRGTLWGALWSHLKLMLSKAELKRGPCFTSDLHMKEELLWGSDESNSSSSCVVTPFPAGQ